MTVNVLTPYRTVPSRWRRPLVLIGLALYCIIVGAAVALLPPQLIVMMTVPLGIAVGIILWILPDLDQVPEALIATLFVTFLAVNSLWPAYIAMDLPGLPWISPPRIVAFALMAIGLYSYATSPKMRGEVAGVFRAMPLVNWAFWIFWGTTVVSLAVSVELIFSLSKWVNNQIYWLFLFVLGGWLALRPGFITRALRVTVWVGILIALEAIYEFHIERIPWDGHIPSFLTIEASYMSKIFGNQARAGTNIFRVRGTFSVSLQMAEYVSLILPFVIHQIVTSKGFWQRALLSAGFLALTIASYMTNARSGVIGFFMALFLYGAFAMLRHWQRERHSLIGIASLAMLPVAAMAFLALSLTWGRLHNMTYGGGMQADSSLARDQQWMLGKPLIVTHPLGHGAGLGGDVLGYVTPGGEGTIDTYYLSLLLEYGFVGFASFMGIFLAQMIYGLRAYLDAESEDELYAAPLVVAMLNFIVIKSVLSSEINLPMAFVFLAFLGAIVVRQNARRTVPETAKVGNARGSLAF